MALYAGVWIRTGTRKVAGITGAWQANVRTEGKTAEKVREIAPAENARFLIFKRFRCVRPGLWITLLTDAAKYRCFFGNAGSKASSACWVFWKKRYGSYG